jgi:hypothetical protein
MAAPLVNGTAYSWVHITLVLFGIPVKGITKISYKRKKEKTNNYGAGEEPVSRGIGRVEYDASIEIYREEWQRVIDASPLKDPLSIPPFDIPVVFGGSRVTAQTDILLACEFLEDAFESNEGDTSIKITLPLVIAGVKHL